MLGTVYKGFQLPGNTHVSSPVTSNNNNELNSSDVNKDIGNNEYISNKFRVIAIKYVTVKSSTILTSLKQEISILQTTHHPNIISLLYSIVCLLLIFIL